MPDLSEVKGPKEEEVYSIDPPLEELEKNSQGSVTEERVNGGEGIEREYKGKEVEDGGGEGNEIEACHERGEDELKPDMGECAVIPCSLPSFSHQQKLNPPLGKVGEGGEVVGEKVEEGVQ